MWAWIWIALAAAACGMIALAYVYTGRRKSYYHELAVRRRELIAGNEPRLRQSVPEPQSTAAFRQSLVARISDFLDPASLAKLREEAIAATDRKTRSYVPTHKKGGTVSYEQIHQSCPACLAFYHGEPVVRFVSQLVGEKIGPAGDHDQSAESILYYDEPGDHIQWHFDHNFYQGRQFTALINLVNRSADGKLSASKLQYRGTDESDVDVDTSENSFVVFEGQRVLHRATPTQPGDLRIMLSMTFNTMAKITPFREFKRRIKDTAFFGLRVLWK
jgi:hypothetical protein